MLYRQGNVRVKCGILSALFIDYINVTNEDKSKSSEAKGFAGLSSMESDVDDLEATQRDIIRAGGQVVRETFAFPGGRRFHFTDPSGNELAVWSDHDPAVA